MTVARGTLLILVMNGLFLSSQLDAQFTFKPQTYNDLEAELTVEAANHTAERGLGAATLTLTVKGPESLEVEPPHLGDAAAAWKEERLASTKVVENHRATWSQVIRLKQTKKGIETLPEVSLRFRDGPGAEWEEAKWVDILKHIRDLPAPASPVDEQPSWVRRWGFVVALAATAVLVLLLWLRKHWRLRRESPLPPEQWALREIQRIEGTLMPPKGEAEAYYTQLSLVVRRYLTERFGWHALQQTTAEFLETLPQASQVTAEQHTLLSELFERCDLAKFARVPTPPEECRHTAELARELVKQTSNGLYELGNDASAKRR
jgi:hypothetical protein